MHKFGLEALQAVKEIKVYNAYDFFTQRYKQAARRYSDGYIKFGVASELPRFVLETILVTAVLATLLISLYLLKTPSELIPMMSVLGLAALRVLPSITRVYTRLNSARYYSNSLDMVHDILKEDDSAELSERAAGKDEKVFNESRPLQLENVEFHYKSAPAPIFKDFNPISNFSAIAQKVVSLQAATAPTKRSSGE